MNQGALRRNACQTTYSQPIELSTAKTCESHAGLVHTDPSGIESVSCTRKLPVDWR